MTTTAVRDVDVHKDITKDEVKLLVREWFDVYGEPPRMIDWDPYLARRKGHPELAARFTEHGGYPTAHRVKDLYGTFTAAIIDAGFYPRYRTKGWQEMDLVDRADYLRAGIALLKASGALDEPPRRGRKR